MKLNYINYNTLIADTLKLCKRLPRKYDIVVGIPNSGMIPAHVIGFELGIPVYTSMQFQDSEFVNSVNVLIIDDSITSGKTLEDNLPFIKMHLDVNSVDTAVIYTDRPDMKVTYFHRRIDAPRIFQWNLFKHGHLKHACLDLDGVLCKDPTIIEDDNKPEIIINHIVNAEPLHIPKKKVFAIITNRIEKYRPQTIEWLEKHNVKYERLIMYPGSASDRRTHFAELGGNGFWKAQKYKEIFGSWFIESDITQAKQIKSVIMDSVYCTDHMIMI